MSGIDGPSRVYTDREIVTELKRELRMRHRVYPRFVNDGRMEEWQQLERVEILEQLIAEIEKRIADRHPDLFGS